MATRVFFVRHGANRMTAEDRYCGSSNPPLSDEGRRQAQCAAKRLASEPIAAIWSSPMIRAQETARTIGNVHGIAPMLEPALREVSHGRWEGQLQADVKTRWADEYKQWSADPFNHAPAGGETGRAVLERAWPAVLKLVANHSDQTIVIVSHKATIRLIAAKLLGIDPQRYRDLLGQDLACINLFAIHAPDRAKLLLWNDISHCGGHPE